MTTTADYQHALEANAYAQQRAQADADLFARLSGAADTLTALVTERATIVADMQTAAEQEAAAKRAQFGTTVCYIEAIPSGGISYERLVWNGTESVWIAAIVTDLSRLDPAMLDLIAHDMPDLLPASVAAASA